VGGTFQLQGIASALGCSHPVAGTQVDLLEKTLLVRTAFNWTPSIAKQRRTAKKILFADNSLLKALNPEVGAGALAENALSEFLGAKYFWRDAKGREVDILLPERKTAIEVKYQNSVFASDEKNLRYFLEHHKGWHGLLATKRNEKRAEIPQIPLWKLLIYGLDGANGKSKNGG
jgi:predicted AAA+ superfamily ATPase